ncbi:MAG: Mov34/MPN/PAD-1 family protein [Candidatus Methylomirabilia bacterium]
MIVTPEEFAQIRRQAEAEYPQECCGVILVGPGDKRLLLPFRNIQNEKHAQDPAHYPRDARTAYYADPQDVMKLMRLEPEGYRAVTFYHSHIDVGAYFSETDKRQAAPGGEALYPDAAYLVVSVVEHKVQGAEGWLRRWLPRLLRRCKVLEARAFRWDPARRDFAPVPFTQRSSC